MVGENEHICIKGRGAFMTETPPPPGRGITRQDNREIPNGGANYSGCKVGVVVASGLPLFVRVGAEKLKQNATGAISEVLARLWPEIAMSITAHVAIHLDEEAVNLGMGFAVPLHEAIRNHLRSRSHIAHKLGYATVVIIVQVRNYNADDMLDRLFTQIVTCLLSSGDSAVNHCRRGGLGLM
jgi:hypothetical protein